MAVPGPPASVQEPPCQEQWSDSSRANPTLLSAWVDGLAWLCALGTVLCMLTCHATASSLPYPARSLPLPGCPSTDLAKAEGM